MGEDLVIPATVLVEVDDWVLRLLGAEAWTILVDDIARGAYRLEQVLEGDLQRAARPRRRCNWAVSE